VAACCREAAASGTSAAAPGTLDAAITGAEIHDGLLALKNGKAPSPASRIPNELQLKYGGGAMAGILQALFAAVWASGKPLEAWLHGTIQYCHKSGAKDDMIEQPLGDHPAACGGQALPQGPGQHGLLRHAEDAGLLHTDSAECLQAGPVL
jgi:hypothetical protein